MKTIFGISCFVVLLVCASIQCFGDWAVGRLSKAQAKELGIEVRSKANGTNEIAVELQIKTEGGLNVFGREDRGRVELQIKQKEACLVSATLKEDRSDRKSVV